MLFFRLGVRQTCAATFSQSNNAHVFLVFYVVFGMYWNVSFLTCVSNAT